ncbi:hypothetical protein DL96DRAFT_1676790 [Flagelloscypha sp. PMI_526]|nr:hypothetical protein DL96DRAFT_1676790 [Flagelloscypha sp. PMI_526]
MLTTNGGKFTNRERLGFAKDGIQGSRVIQALPRLINVPEYPWCPESSYWEMVSSSIEHSLLREYSFSFYDGYLSILLGTQSLQFALTGRSNVIPDITAITLSFSTNFIATIAIALTTQPQLRPAFCHSKLGNQPDIGTAAYLSAINYLSALYPTVLIIIFSRQSKRRDSFDARMSNHEAQYEQKRSGEGVHGETLTFPSQMGSQRNTHTSWEPDEWQKARGSYTNFVV